MKIHFIYLLILFLFISCSSRDESVNENNTSTLPKTITATSKYGNIISEYQYDGNKIKSIISNNGSKSFFFYTNNLITKSIVTLSNPYNETYEVNYEYKNNKISKASFTGFLSFNIYYTWIDDNHVSFIDDKIKPTNAIDKTDLYFDNGNIVKSTNHLYYPNNFTIDKVDIIESDNNNNPFKNIEGLSLLINFNNENIFFYQTNNVTKITTTRAGVDNNGQVISENYSKNFQFNLNAKNFPEIYNITDSYGNYYSKYEFSYSEN